MKFILFTLLLAGTVFISSCGTSNIKQPEYRDIREIRLVELGLLQTTAGIDLIFYNPNNTGVQLSEARGDVYVDGDYFGRFSLDEKVNVRKRSEFVVPILVRMDMIGAVKKQHEILKKKEVMVKIDGMARVRKAGYAREIPVKFESLQNLEKFRNLVSR